MFWGLVLQEFVFQKMLLGNLTSVLILCSHSLQKPDHKPELTFLNAREMLPVREGRQLHILDRPEAEELFVGYP